LLRAETTSPTEDIISAELVRAKVIGEAPAARRGSQQSLVIDPGRAPLWPAVRAYFGILLFAVSGGILIQMQAGKAEADTSGKKGPLELVPARAGFLRVVARPWAEVVVDGQRIEVTPFARPIPLTGGTHYVTLKHPKAPEERRIIKVTPAETVVLDVTMGVKGMTIADAGAGGSAP
jgi:serine/threonine-protein kinase